jgi:DNA-binding protein H-NS
LLHYSTIIKILLIVNREVLHLLHVRCKENLPSKLLSGIDSGLAVASDSGRGKPSMRKRRKKMAEADVSDVDLDQMTETELMDLIKAAVERLTPARYSEVIEAVQAKRRTKEAEVKEAFMAEMRERAMQMGLSFDALFGVRRTRAGAGQPLVPKYRGPHGETWSGRGRQPRWLAELEASGHQREEFRIKEESE